MLLLGHTPTGIANERDNARTMNLTRHSVAGFRTRDLVFADRFEDSEQVRSGTLASPPMTEAEACAEFGSQLDNPESTVPRRRIQGIIPGQTI